MSIHPSVSKSVFPSVHPASRVPAALLGGISVDADAQAFFDAAAITDATQQSAVSALVADLKAAGIWNRSVAIYPFVGGSASSHKYNLKNPADTDAAKRLAFTGTWTHDNNGATPDGTTAYADTKIEPNEDFPPYSFSGWVYSRTTTAWGAGDYYFFGVTGGGYIDFDMFFNDRLYVMVGSLPSLQITSISLPSYGGFWGSNARGFSFLRAYRNGATLGTQTSGRYGYLPDTNPEVRRTLYLGSNNTGSSTSKTPRNIAFAAFCYGMTDTQVAAINTAVQAFQTTLGRNV